MILEENGNVIIKNAEDFSLEKTVECGQFFHYEKFNSGKYGIVYRDRLLLCREDKENSKIILYNQSIEDYETIWRNFFDLNRDCKEINDYLLTHDDKMEEILRVSRGIRLINGDFTETLMSFIISQNKQISHIKKIVKDISEAYGKYLGETDGVRFYSFPDKEVLFNISEEEYRELKTGFRAPYLRDAALKLNGELEEKKLKSEGYDAALNDLMKIKGVGAKVANCVLLYSLNYKQAFPVDVWIKRIVEKIYFGKSVENKDIYRFAKERFGNYGGYAQQYLFYYARNIKD